MGHVSMLRHTCNLIRNEHQIGSQTNQKYFRPVVDWVVEIVTTLKNLCLPQKLTN